MLHLDRSRAGSFGADPERYDRSRPGYPAALIDALESRRARSVLDVGCGTGIAARLLAPEIEVLGIEPDPRMAEVARRHGIDVECGTFEEWDDRGRKFDLLMSGQAWHWVDPVVGAAKAARVLGDVGRLALFWNCGRQDPELGRELSDVYARYRPDLDSHSIALGHVDDARFDRATEGIDQTGAFGPVERLSFMWSTWYSRADWLDQLPTHSDHSRLPPETLGELLEAVGNVLDGHGGGFTMTYEAILLRADLR